MVIDGENDLATLKPALAEEWHPHLNGSLRPSHLTASSGQKVWWLCGEGHEWQAAPTTRSAGHGCPVCAGRTVVTGVNDLATLRPAIADQWHPTRNGHLRPEMVRPGADLVVWWRCGHGFEWQAKISQRSRSKRADDALCPIDRGRLVVTGVNDLATLRPAVASEWHPTRNLGLLPNQVRATSLEKVWWRCVDGHEWQASPRDGRSPRCPFETGRKVEAGFNDLASAQPALASEWHPTMNDGLEPTTVTVGSPRFVWWSCPAGHPPYRAQIEKRSKGSGCASCASYGFDPSIPATTYLLVHRDESLVKVGVCNQGSNRIHRLKIRGWDLVEAVHHSTGREALNHERDVLVRFAGIADAAAPGLAGRKERAARGVDGMTEMFDLRSFGGSTPSLDMPRPEVCVQSVDPSKESVTLAVRDASGKERIVGNASTIGKGPLAAGDVVEARFQYVLDPSEPTMVQPRIVRKRTDKTADQCSLDQFADAGTNKDVPVDDSVGT